MRQLWLVEPKRADQMANDEVQLKARATSCLVGLSLHYLNSTIYGLG